MSSMAAGPGSPGGLPCPGCMPISPFCHRGTVLWFCREKCDLYGENGSRCWGVNHPAHCMEIVEQITAMIFKKEVSPELKEGINMQKLATEGKKPIAQPKDQKTVRADTSVAVSTKHKEYLDECAKIFDRPVKEILAAIIQRQINEDAKMAKLPELRIAAAQYATGAA